jgi:hypothetical protein
MCQLNSPPSTSAGSDAGEAAGSAMAVGTRVAPRRLRRLLVPKAAQVVVDIAAEEEEEAAARGVERRATAAGALARLAPPNDFPRRRRAPVEAAAGATSALRVIVVIMLVTSLALSSQRSRGCSCCEKCRARRRVDGPPGRREKTSGCRRHRTPRHYVRRNLRCERQKRTSKMGILSFAPHRNARTTPSLFVVGGGGVVSCKKTQPRWRGAGAPRGAA